MSPKKPGRTARRRFSEVGQSQRLRIIHALKKSNGLPVGELAERLDLSYMGIKQHCAELERQGLVDTWRTPKPIGRPELAYRLTPKASVYFPTGTNAITIHLLQTAKSLYGANAPEKLLLGVFRAKTQDYQSQITGSDPAARAREFASVREAEGCLAELVREPRLMIVEYHSLIADLLEAFPLVGRLEREMIEQVIGVPVDRQEEQISGLYQCRFILRHDQ